MDFGVLCCAMYLSHRILWLVLGKFFPSIWTDDYHLSVCHFENMGRNVPQQTLMVSPMAGCSNLNQLGLAGSILLLLLPQLYMPLLDLCPSIPGSKEVL